MNKRKESKKPEAVAGSAASDKTRFGRSNVWTAIFLVAITIVAYAPVLHYGFLNYDDPQYVYQNPNVAGGLTRQSIVWAFTTGYSSNWHPLTWLFHMLDVQLFGLNAGAHHLTNLVFHIANTLLLFWILVRTTRARGPGTLVAALFAVHPLHVESVAWIAERKDVLSTFFWMLTLCAYVRYVERPRRTRYLAVLGCFAAGLMAKPMLVTLPFVLLLLDFWPLGRLTFRTPSNFAQLFREKIPLLMLTGISSAVTFLAQQKGGAMVGVDTIPMASRAANAFIAYWTYLLRMLWPARLAVLYPAVPGIRDWWFTAALALIGLSVLSIRIAGSRPYIPVGWFWYLGTLVPVIGLVQVGRQATADRYTYVPLIGLFLIIAFGVSDALAWLPGRRLLCLAGGGLAIAACLWITRAQLRYWAGSETLWERALNVTADNALAHFNLAIALQSGGRLDAAMPHYSEAVRIEPALRRKPQYAEAHYAVANVLMQSGKSDRLDEAAGHLAEAIRGEPGFPEAHNVFGIYYLMMSKPDRAIAEFHEAIRLKPGYAGAHNNLGTALGNQGRIDEAISEYAEAVRLEPGYADAHTNLGILLAKQGKANDAIAHFSEVLRISSDNPTARAWLADLTRQNSSAR